MMLGKMLDDVKGVIFDLDGTLVDSMWVWGLINIEYLNSRGIDVPSNLNRDIEGMSFTETAIYFKEKFKLPDTIEEIKGEWNSMARDYYANKINLKEGVLDFLNLLKSKNYKIGIGTSNHRELVDLVLKRNGIYDYFDTIRTACEVGKSKPFPDIFLKVAEDLGLSPEECLVFEDTYAGVLAAKRAGMKVIAISDELSLPYKEDINELADQYIENFINIA